MKGVLARGQNAMMKGVASRAEMELMGAELIRQFSWQCHPFATLFATNHYYNRGPLASPEGPTQARQSSSCNPINFQRFQECSASDRWQPIARQFTRLNFAQFIT